jgi:hypothetical protein
MSTLQQNWRKGQNRLCLEVRGVGGRGKRWGAWGRDDSNNVCTYEYMNKEKSSFLTFCPMRPPGLGLLG